MYRCGSLSLAARSAICGQRLRQRSRPARGGRAEPGTHLGEEVSHDHAALGVRVADAHGEPAPAADELVGDVGLLADGVPDHAERGDHLDVWPQQLARLEEADDGGGAALVPRHAGHRAARLDVAPARVVRDALVRAEIE